ncbi:ubiquitin carboxyl-terminal hydrolase L5 [Galdieria sulphuraria]|uniref:Ubiquitin carboxyl-terminal hydrolase n=1 Tax=Galdieria sulphuraria TaxID=130081 RepID=M2XJ66_GALSU|nr:ubiquitin carboxyl-terminal hydrolase L5 [Galdieria sulphuraria]EME30152.1 ubiquitin carboxyl-terminal hydrolase L5 [Galdieria sulphuraria]|eukprot:XP_005706672.1 ubiquitin carboxyl-terminal hydrolase L5 [Galdieria sulphuraria]
MEDGGWNTIESDPAVFTQLLEDLGVKDVKVEEVLQLDAAFLRSLEPVHGLIFLFKWLPDQGSEQELSFSQDVDLFFANQVIQNACGTQALLSVVFNAKDLELGSELAEFKEFTKDFDPQTRGLALSNSETIRSAHNSLSGLQHFSFEFDEKEKSDSFHFISYVPFQGRIYELDGLKKGPICRGSYTAERHWTDVAISEIEKRIERYGEGEIRFNLLAVVRDPLKIWQQELLSYQTALESCSLEVERMSISMQMKEIQTRMEDEKRRSIRRESNRRRHNMLPFIFHLFKWLHENSDLSFT